jgi:hypothetical protein
VLVVTFEWWTSHATKSYMSKKCGLPETLLPPLCIKYWLVKQLVKALNHTSEALQYTRSMSEATVETDTLNSHFTVQGETSYMLRLEKPSSSGM